MNKPTKLIISLLLPFLAGAIGSLATYTNIPTWYATLAKPEFNPPNWIFGPVWTTLYVLMGVSLYLVWTTKTKHKKQSACIAYATQLSLNALWSLVFFGAHWFVGSSVIVILLWAAIVATIKLFWPISKSAAWMLVPYLAWVSFASVLTLAVSSLNT
ncbi:MAG: tryptophan-rich sensory protein [Candidatus Woesebacteria bacterium]|jgi:tryptophan-rich sensory protein